MLESMSRAAKIPAVRNFPFAQTVRRLSPLAPRLITPRGTSRRYRPSMSATNDVTEMVERARLEMHRRDAAIYGLTNTQLVAGLLDFPLPDSGRSFVWLGYWMKDGDQGAGVSPSVTVATSPIGAAHELRDRLGVGEPYEWRPTGRSIAAQSEVVGSTVPLKVARGGKLAADLQDGDTYVVLVVGAATSLTETPAIERVIDRRGLVEGWARLAASS